MKIIWSPLAIQRVIEIAEYITQDSQDAAIKWVDSIFEITERLQDFPMSGRVVPEANREDIREIIHRNYRIIYKVSETQVMILTVRHTRQILPEEDLQ